MELYTATTPAPLTKESTMEITIVPPPTAMDPFQLTVARDATVATIMDMIKEQTTIPPQYQILMYNGVQVPTNKNLQELGITNGAHLQISADLSGGCCCSWCSIL